MTPRLLRRRPVTDVAREARLEELWLQMHGRVCHVCGVRARSDAVVIRHDLAGREVRYTTCPKCAAAAENGTLSSTAHAQALRLPPSDEAARALGPVVRFADVPGASPDVPNPAPWAHLDRADLHRRVVAYRVDRAARTHNPCRYCGRSVTPVGWVTDGWGDDGSCPPCAIDLTPLGSDDARRGIVLAVLADLNPPMGQRTITAPDALRLVPFWHETERAKPGGEEAWSHIDRSGLLAAVDRLVTCGALDAPGGWSPTTARVPAW